MMRETTAKNMNENLKHVNILVGNFSNITHRNGIDEKVRKIAKIFTPKKRQKWW